MNQMPLIAEALPPPCPPPKAKAPPKRVKAPSPTKLQKSCDQKLVALAEGRLSPKTQIEKRLVGTESARATLAKLRAEHKDLAKLIVAADEHMCLVSHHLSAFARLVESERDAPSQAPKPSRSVERSRRATGNLQQRRARRRAS